MDKGTQQIVTPKTGQGILIQADGHNTLKRSGVWVIDGENFISQEPVATRVFPDKTTISAYSLGVNLLHNKLHDEVGIDIEEESATTKLEVIPNPPPPLLK
ncbi:hypothetical protein [Legionella tunisiensis]|uniref:hypothetical protein n=1 Tax=Legionella tunisiensis TaxID=1034944 RepID=UPI0012EA7997|nr:hypothetical protein [Legionella tunisiensis]